MGTAIYRKLAKSNITKNYRFFIPRILTEAGLLACLFITFTMTIDKKVCQGYGGAYMSFIMAIGTVIVSLLSLVLMIYSNSFLMKQRKPEFGLYHCLGMEKRHVGKVLFHESLMTSVISIVSGAAFGVLFYKVCSLIICKILHTDSITGFYYIKPISLVPPIILFIVIDIIAYIINRISIARMRPVELISSGHKGEKEPRVRWVLLVLGVICLGSGYAISLSIKSPIKALELFFLAVFLVIFGTYFLFVAGSIFVLKVLKKNEKFYYNRLNMPCVSGLLYRMKQNAVGLASIAILVTSVLVMLSTTISLYTGMNSAIDDMFPQQCYVMTERNGYEIIDPKDAEKCAYEVASKMGFEIEKGSVQRYLEVTLVKNDNNFDFMEYDEAELDNVVNFLIVKKSDYENMMGKKTDIGDKDVIYYPITISEKETPSVFHISGEDFNVIEKIEAFPISSAMGNVVPVYGIVANDEVVDKWYEEQKALFGDFASEFDERYAIEFKDPDRFYREGKDYSPELLKAIRPYMDGFDSGMVGYNVESCADVRDELFSLYGTLLFLGLILGTVFIFTTALIIYYKQISEGYEDRDRFKIMEKIGMSQKEVKKTIKTQVVMVFFLPLIVAGIHVAFAFPIIVKLLNLLLMGDTMHYVICTLIVYLSFAIVYGLIYSGTSKTYYNIVK